ncbi:tetratricopeptide repeat-containing sensor histidine kinase [Aquimarina pacifica]|uniref:tetratricopeptide repeat-containing sensor histidine kinase n=1 Tax=Aquimarina pacifica TaxID=1296415 RepID=UPI0004716F5D|nr:sensor histidine kinase [Aquimarina pacifica]
MPRRNRYITTVLFALHFCVFSQQKQKALELIENIESKADTDEKLYLLDSLSRELSSLQGNHFEFYKKYYPKYTFQYIDLAKKLDSFDLAAFRTSKLTYHYLNLIGKPDSALTIINSVIRDSNKIKKRINLGHLYLKRAGANYQIDNLEKALVDYEKAQKIYNKTGDTIYEADAVYFNGQATERLGRFADALLKYQKSNRLYTKMKDTAYIAYTGLAISGIFSQLYLLDKSFDERQRIRTLLRKQKNMDYIALSELYINDARDYVKRQEYEKEEEAYLSALSLLRREENTTASTFRARAYVSDFYSKHDRVKLARKHLDTLELETNLINSPYDRIFYLKALSSYKMAQKDYDGAIPLLNEELAIFAKSNDLRGQVHIENRLYEAHKEIKRTDQAMAHLQRHILLKDSLYNMVRSNSVIYYQTLYEAEKRDNKIALQEANINILEAQGRTKKNLLIFGSIGLSLLFISLYLYRNRTLLIRNKKLQHSFLQELLQTQEKVSKRISKDLHDSVGQSLLLVKNNVIRNNDTKTAKVVDGVIDEVRQISRSLHPFTLEELGLTITLQSSIEMIDENYDIFVSAEIDNIDSVFDPEKEINIYRLVQESFNNILKHSNARSAEIKVINKENDVEIIIADNGVGFDIAQEKTAMSKIGLKTLNERSKFLRATFNILSEINEGTTLIFNIPKRVEA